MLRTLLVPLDGSSIGEHALPFARHIARRSGAAIELVHVHAPQQIIFVDGLPVVDEELHSLGHQHDRVYLERIAESLAAEDGTSVRVHVVDGAIVPALLQQAKTMEADLIVMTTHGRGGLARAWLGSVADGLIRHSELPVLLIHPDDAAPDPAREDLFPRVLVPIEPSSAAEDVPAALRTFDPEQQSSYTLLRIVEPRNRHEAEAETSQSTASRSGVTTTSIANEQPARAILRFASEHQVNLIAVQPHNESGLRRMLLGSVADKLIRGATVPVLVFRAGRNQA